MVQVNNNAICLQDNVSLVKSISFTSKLQALKDGKDSMDNRETVSPYEWDNKSLSLNGVKGGHINIVVHLTLCHYLLIQGIADVTSTENRAAGHKWPLLGHTRKYTQTRILIAGAVYM
jgi:hypothetical protein